MFYGEKLKELRNNISQKEISNILNIKRNTYATYENEEVIIPIKHLIKICDYFDISIDFIFGFRNKSYKNNKKGFNLELVSQRLKEFRNSNNISQGRLAIILKCSPTTIAGYESSRYLIATPFLYTICKKYNISADYLLGKINNPKYLS